MKKVLRNISFALLISSLSPSLSHGVAGLTPGSFLADGAIFAIFYTSSVIQQALSQFSLLQSGKHLLTGGFKRAQISFQIYQKAKKFKALEHKLKNLEEGYRNSLTNKTEKPPLDKPQCQLVNEMSVLIADLKSKIKEKSLVSKKQSFNLKSQKRKVDEQIINMKSEDLEKTLDGRKHMSETRKNFETASLEHSNIKAKIKEIEALEQEITNNRNKRVNREQLIKSLDSLDPTFLAIANDCDAILSNNQSSNARKQQYRTLGTDFTRRIGTAQNRADAVIKRSISSSNLRTNNTNPHF